jgi:two-component system, LytTR family, sensor kinase
MSDIVPYMIPNKSVNFLTRKILLHSIFWILVLMFFSYLLGTPNENPFYAGFLFSFSSSGYYGYNLYRDLLSHPSIFTSKEISAVQPVQFLYLGFICLLLSLFPFFTQWFFYWICNNPEMPPTGRSILFMMVVVYLVVVVVGAFNLLKEIYTSEAKIRPWRTRVLEAQLKLEGTGAAVPENAGSSSFPFQYPQHIVWVCIEKSEETPDMILKLSNLLDYLFYQVDKPSGKPEQ